MRFQIILNQSFRVYTLSNIAIMTMSPMSFFVILLVIGSINAELETGKDGNPPTEPTSTDTGFPVNDDDVYNDNNDDETSRYKRQAKGRCNGRCNFRFSCRSPSCIKRNRECGCNWP